MGGRQSRGHYGEVGITTRKYRVIVLGVSEEMPYLQSSPRDQANPLVPVKGRTRLGWEEQIVTH